MISYTHNNVYVGIRIQKSIKIYTAIYLLLNYRYPMIIEFVKRKDKISVKLLLSWVFTCFFFLLIMLITGKRKGTNLDNNDKLFYKLEKNASLTNFNWLLILLNLHFFQEADEPN